MGMRVGVIGAGAWGTALGHLMAGQDCEVVIWAFEPEVAEEITSTTRTRPTFRAWNCPRTSGPPPSFPSA